MQKGTLSFFGKLENGNFSSLKKLLAILVRDCNFQKGLNSDKCKKTIGNRCQKEILVICFFW